MVIVTALNNVRCSLRPELIASVVGGAPTMVRLTNGLSLEIRESADDVQRQLELARQTAEPAAAGRGSHGRAH
ncbi:MAG: flagellar FlbD family protein [Candidatus Rokubacteria bacterium]|nr:flagellar FlbD family protein [Candidatus Rokubacteria bacterium]MBI4593698.1 flagellar FlbD family protein [Candidatus Rokubacteria bacterium]